MSSDVAISIRNVSKKFRLFSSPKERLAEALHPFRKQFHREFWALNDVSFDIRRGEIVGILGRNGSGKSTLLQIICSVMRPTHGEVHVNGRISALLELGAGFNPEFTGRDNVLLNGSIIGISRKEMLRRLPAIEAFADIGEFFDQPVKMYSSGMFVRVAFAAAIHVDPEILVVDEALSVGDSKFQHRCFQRIREFMEQGKTILVVSHSTDTLLRICHRGIVLEAGKLDQIGTISSAVNHYQNLLFGKSREAINSPAAPNPDPKSNASIPPPASVGSLSGEVRDRISEKSSYNKHEERLGKGSATIIDFDVLVDDKQNPHEIPAQTEVDLIVKVHFNQGLNGVSVGFAFVTIDGTYVFGTNSAMLGQKLLSVDAGGIIAVKFRFTSRLAGGEYFLNIGCNQLIDGEDRFLDVRRSVARIKFSDTPHVAGFVDLGVNYEVIDLSATSTTNS